VEVLEGAVFCCEERDLEFLSRQLGGHLERRADGWAITRLVGHLQLPSGEVLHITSPKAATAAVLAWVAYVDPSLRALRYLGRVPEALDEGTLAGVIARLFVTEFIVAATRLGVIRQYHRVGVRSSTVRGGIDFARLARLGGDLSRLPCIVWARQPETPLNRFLAAVVQRIALDRVMREACQREMSEVIALLGDVRPAVSSQILEGTSPLPRTERPFEGACSLGRLILRHTSLQEGQERQGFSFLINLEALFERTIAMAFREAGIAAVAKAPVPYRRVVGGETPDGSGSLEMDLFCPGLPDGPLVVDAKYKAHVSSGNLQQMVTYCFVTGARRAVLVFPKGNLTDRRSYLFAGKSGKDIRIDLAELATDARDVVGWRQNARLLVADVLGHADHMIAAVCATG